MAWTDERVELLKKLWGEGLSASQIAGRLGTIPWEVLTDISRRVPRFYREP